MVVDANYQFPCFFLFPHSDIRKSRGNTKEPTSLLAVYNWPLLPKLGIRIHSVCLARTHSECTCTFEPPRVLVSAGTKAVYYNSNIRFHNLRTIQTLEASLALE